MKLHADSSCLYGRGKSELHTITLQMGAAPIFPSDFSGKIAEKSLIVNSTVENTSFHPSEKKNSTINDISGKTFSARKHCRRHEKIHLEVPPLPCTVEGCTFRTTRGDKLRDHMVRNHGYVK